MEIVTVSLLGLIAFGLGSIPFSILIGRWFLGKDIRHYGDGNPGSANVFRAGGHKIGYIAVLLDLAKGVPAVYVAHVVFDVPMTGVVIIALCAILGHAFSPFLRFRGGKAIAVTFGTLLALPQLDTVIIFAAFIVFGALFIETDAWGIMFGTTGSLVFLLISRGTSWETFLMAGILIILVVKHMTSLRRLPGFHGWLVQRVRNMAHRSPTVD